VQITYIYIYIYIYFFLSNISKGTDFLHEGVTNCVTVFDTKFSCKHSILSWHSRDLSLSDVIYRGVHFHLTKCKKIWFQTRQLTITWLLTQIDKTEKCGPNKAVGIWPSGKRGYTIKYTLILKNWKGQQTVKKNLINIPRTSTRELKNLHTD